MKPFAPDNFTDNKIVYHKTANTVFKFGEILNQYFTGYSLIKVEQLQRNEINSENYKITLKIKNKAQIFLLRKHKFLSQPNKIDFYLGLIKKLADKNLPVSRIIPAKNKKLWVKSNLNSFTLFKFIAGNHFYPTTASFASLAQNIAKMHKAFNGLSQNDFATIKKLSGQGRAYFNIVKTYSAQDFIKLQQLIDGKKTKTVVDKLVLTKLPRLIKICAEVKANRNLLSKLPKKIIHSDLHTHNVIADVKSIKAILDFDSCRIAWLGTDLGMAIHRFGRQFFINHQSKAKKDAPKLVKLFLASYLKINKLSNQEIKLLPIILKDEFLKKILFVLKGIYLQNNVVWAKDLPKFLVFIEEINYFWN